MSRATAVGILSLLLTATASGQSKPLKVSISVDMEGIDGVVCSDQVSAHDFIAFSSTG